MSIKIMAEPDVEYLRKKFYESVDKSSTARDFLNELEKNSEKDASIIKGYTAAMRMVMAKHAFNPYHKFKYFLDGKKDLESALLKDSLNLELRLIRFAIQNNVPFFLNYSSDIISDKNFLIKNLDQLNTGKSNDRQLKKYIIDYLSQSSHCTRAEKEAILKV